mgnify:CR=1 FL=1
MRPMIHVVNRKSYRGTSVYIGRPSVFGNPIIIGRDGDRDEVIRRYRCWLWTEIQRGTGSVWEELLRLCELARQGDLVLSCWCHPLPCHGGVIRAALLWLQAGMPNSKECHAK